jgi:hypothetical protein
MQVDVEDRLPSLSIAIEYRAIAALGAPMLFRQGCGRAEQ